MRSTDYDFAKHTIQDPIHGSISFGPIERRIIDHRLYQRLRGLRQNSLLYLVFPSANHTRFDHSVGVMCVAGRFFDAIIVNQRKICAVATHRKTYQAGYRVADKQMSQLFAELDREPYYRIVLRAAALFHDIGHGPLSHLFDKFFPLVTEVKSLLSDARYQHIHASLAATEAKKNVRKPIAHEVLSCIIATRVLHDIAGTLQPYNISVEEMARDVCAAIDKDVEPSKRTTSLPYNVATLLHDIISSDIDADRMDYLMRDSHMCGVNYGLYDQDRILKSMCAYADMKNKTIRASIRYSGVGALEDLLIARYQMHAQIYGHKTNRACSAMLDAIRERLKDVAWKWYKGCATLDDLLSRFSAFDDEQFVGLLCAQTIDNNVGAVKDIAEKLFFDRRLVKRVFEERVPCAGKDRQKEKRTERRVEQHLRRLQNASLSARTDIFENKGPKIRASNYSLKVLRKHHKREYYQVHELKEFSTVAHYLPEAERTYRIYAKEKNVRAAKALMPT